MQIINQWVVELMNARQILYATNFGYFVSTEEGLLPIQEEDAIRLIKK